MHRNFGGHMKVRRETEELIFFFCLVGSGDWTLTWPLAPLVINPFCEVKMESPSETNKAKIIGKEAGKDSG